MGRRDRLVQKWLTNPPTDAPFEEVAGVLNYFFRGKIRKKGSSHRVVRDERLRGYSEFDPYGEFSISKVGGQRVKGYQLQTLARAIQIITEEEEVSDK